MTVVSRSLSQLVDIGSLFKVLLELLVCFVLMGLGRCLQGALIRYE